MDLSLRSNPDSYIDRKNESGIIENRINSDASTVIGISGVRGAGKSSLALKVVKKCDEDGYFTLLINSPTGYEAREFLITIYTRICEATIKKLEQRFGINNTLEGKAEQMKSEIKNNITAIISGLLLFVIISGVFVSYYVQKQNSEITTKRIADIDEYIGLIEKMKNDSTAIPDLPFNSDYRSSTLVSKSISVIDTIPYNYHRILNSLRQEKIKLRKDDQNSTIKVFTKITILIISSFLLYLILLFLYIYLLKPKFKLRKNIITNPAEYGLYKVSQENLEYLKYQSTISSVNEIGAQVWKLSSKLTRGRSLETRPISLPGLTADLSVYIHNISLVFNNKVILCLDELDKINDPIQLENLLKGIKGIMGQRNLYFILTVSEDALSNFLTRLRGKRNLIESSFEEIIQLSRIESELAFKIIEATLDDHAIQKKSENAQWKRNYLLAYSFSGGIPRELKRNLLKLRDVHIEITSASSLHIWEFFFSDMIISTIDWIKISPYPDDVKSALLIFTEIVFKKIHEAITNDKIFFTKWLIEESGKIMGQGKLVLEEKITDEDQVEKSILEMIVCSLFIQICYFPIEQLNARTYLIIELLDSISNSTLYTKKRIKTFMDNLDNFTSASILSPSELK